MVTAVSSSVVALSASDVRDRVDRDVDRRGLGHAARGHRVGVAVGAVVVGVRRVGDGAVAVVDDRAVAPWVTPVTIGVPSNVSLASTLVVTAVSSLVVALSSAMSATAVIVTLTVAVSVTPPDVTV